MWIFDYNNVRNSINHSLNSLQSQIDRIILPNYTSYRNNLNDTLTNLQEHFNNRNIPPDYSYTIDRINDTLTNLQDLKNGVLLLPDFSSQIYTLNSKEIAMGVRIVTMDNANKDLNVQIMCDINSYQEHANAIVISSYFTNDINQILFQKIYLCERIDELSETGSISHIQALDLVYVEQDRVRPLESQIDINKHDISYI
jgi:hypothetical protein